MMLNINIITCLKSEIQEKFGIYTEILPPKIIFIFKLLLKLLDQKKKKKKRVSTFHTESEDSPQAVDEEE